MHCLLNHAKRFGEHGNNTSNFVVVDVAEDGNVNVDKFAMYFELK